MRCNKFILVLTLLILCLSFIRDSVIRESWGGSSLPILFKEAKQQLQTQKWKQAITTYRKILQKEPENNYVHANIGVALSRMNRHREALLSYEKALSLGFESDMFRYNRGLSFAFLNLLEEAESEYKKALKMNSRLILADYDLGIIYNRQSRIDEALNQVEKIYPRNEKLALKLYRSIQGPYKSVTVDNGGSIIGQVKLIGPQPKARSFHLIHSPNISYCNRMSDGKGHRIIHDFVRSKDFGLSNTVVAILNVKRGKPFSAKMYSMKIRLCHPKDYVIGIRNGSDILVENMDPIKHEVATYEVIKPKQNISNLRLANSSKVDQKSNKSVLAKSTQIRSIFGHPDTREFIIKCNLHPFLQTSAWIVENPYFTTTDKNGRFQIDDVPSGTFEVVAWHPFMEPERGTITIEPGKTVSIDFEFKSDKDKRKLYSNDIKGYRFNTWYDSHKNFYGGERVDDPVEILQGFENPNTVVKQQ